MMFRNRLFQRLTSALVLTTFTSLTLSPLSAAARAYDAAEKAGLLERGPAAGSSAAQGGNSGRSSRVALQPLGADEQFAQLLADIHEELKAATPQLAMARGARLRHARQGDGQASASATEIQLTPFAGTDIGARVSAIRTKAGQARRLFATLEEDFRATEQHLRNSRMAPEILQRHADAVAQFASRRGDFERLADGLERAAGGADQASALDGLAAFMVQHRNTKTHQYGNPNKLPFGISAGKVRAPHASKEDYQASLFPPKFEALVLAGAVPDGVTFAAAALPAVPVAADLAETDDVQLTPAVREKALALGRNPVKIYNWVRNNVEFVPSYGSIQGSDLTLQNKRGNAFDTASLLIALYRASGIPARYVYGTIDVPAAKAMNWVGGVSKPEAAQSLLGQGGIPNVGMLAGGAIGAIRMEHVWVQAYVDYAPSRGAVNQTPDAWVPMDASFKQYRFSTGMNITRNVPVDSADVLAQMQQGSTSDASQGYVQNLSQANLQSQIAAYQNRVKAYVESQKAAPSVADVLGSQKSIAEEHAILLGSLPYATVAIGQTFNTLPDNLRWKFRTGIYAADGYSDGGESIIEVNQSTAKLAGKKITLSFVPATQADQDLINSYIPQPHADGSPLQPSELPSSLPGYLLKMKAEFRVDGRVVAQTSQSFSMGSDVMQSGQYFNPAHGRWDGGADNAITVGEYNAIGIDLQGIGAPQLNAHQAKLEATKAKFTRFQQNPGDTTPLNDVSKEDITGDTLHGGILGYFAQIDTSDRLTARTLNTVTNYRLPSYGRFFTAAQTTYWFGIARKVTFPGVGIDVDYIAYHTEAKDGDRAKRVDFIRMTGAASSAAEHAVPEQMFRNPNLAPADPGQPQGVSAVKALAVAAAQGQKIYSLGPDNQALHGTILQGLQIAQDVKWEIANALASGKEVTVHERDVNVNGWNGSGYLILDPETGAGAYKIAGGTNGGGVWWLGAVGGASAAFVLGIAAFLATLATATVGAVIVFWILILALVLANVALMYQNWSGMSDEDQACYLGGILTGFGFAGLMSLPGWLGKILAAIGIGTTGGTSTSPGQSCGAF